MNIRDELISELAPEEARVQYDDMDAMKIGSSAQTMTEAVVLLIEALGKYTAVIKAEVDENTADLTKEARYEVIHSWAGAQASISKIAWMLRIDGDEAYRRSIEAAKKDEAPELGDL